MLSLRLIAFSFIALEDVSLKKFESYFLTQNVVQMLNVV